jgi:hypothetical protein
MKIAICGLDCEACPAFIAHHTGDRALREKTAVEWSKSYHFAFSPEMVDCVGCTTTDGVHIGHCAECKMRVCGFARKVENCGLCPDYPCEIIGGFIAQVAPAKENLERIRGARKS